MALDRDETSEGQPLVSVIVTTHNRPLGVEAAVRSIQEVAPVGSSEVVVVDDGSDAEHSARLDLLTGDGVRVLHQADLGLAVARNAGAVAATGEWLSFLDDDDRWLGGWWTHLVPMLQRTDVGVASGGARLVSPTGRIMRDEPPRPLGPIFGDITAQYLAGCFAVRREVFDAAGGYLPGLSSSHQSELFIRVAAVCEELGLSSEHTTAAVAGIERRDDTDRSLSNPRLLFDGTRWILARHAERFALDRRERSNWEGIAALAGVRLGDRRAPALALRSALDRPTQVRPWLRLVAVATPAARRRWGSSGDFRSPSPSHDRPLAHASTLQRDRVISTDSGFAGFFLPWRYRENPPAPSEVHGTPFCEGSSWRDDLRLQAPVYRWGARLARHGEMSVLDVGCGSGHKLAQIVAPRAGRCVGVDQGRAIEIARRELPRGEWIVADLTHAAGWSELPRSDLVICADVIEHLPEPYELLLRLRSVVAPGGHLLISTPDRSRLDDSTPSGPPRNPWHIREWSRMEFELLLESAGFDILRTRRLLPKAYSPTVLDTKRLVARTLRRRAIPDRRSSMAFLVRPSES